MGGQVALASMIILTVALLSWATYALRRVVEQFEATEISEQLRANEPISLGATHSQGLEQRHACLAHAGTAPDAQAASSAAFAWAPWRPGTRTHARLLELAGRAPPPSDLEPAHDAPSAS